MAKKKPQITKKKQKKIVRYRKPRNLNVGMIIFAIIFIYMFFSVSTYLRKEKVQFYEVTEGSIVNDKTYSGIILRKEETEYSNYSGYINYYIREGKRAAVGTNIYSIDETGTLSTVLADSAEGNINLTEENLMDIKKQLSSFSVTYQDNKFSSVYDVKYSLEAAVFEYVNFNALVSLDQMMKTKGSNFVQVTAPKSGVISYAIDSYESLEANQISEASFNRSNYTRAITKSGKLVEQGAPIYKVVTDDTWSIVFAMSKEDLASYGGETSLKVIFPGRNLTTNAAFSIIIGSDGESYGKLDFTKYMVQFVSERFIDFEIISSKTEGLKIPVSAVTNKSFYLVPVSYLSKGGDSSDEGFYKEVYSEEGTPSIVFVSTTLYNSTEEYYYIDMKEDSQLKAGDYIVKPNSSDRYQIGSTASLEGVYNINKGYTVFKQVEALSQSDEYYIVKKGTKFGLSVYDHIVLDASIIEREGVLIYQ